MGHSPDGVRSLQHKDINKLIITRVVCKKKYNFVKLKWSFFGWNGLESLVGLNARLKRTERHFHEESSKRRPETCRRHEAPRCCAGAYSLRMSSTKAVSRSSPISLYFSFSETSSSASLVNKKNVRKIFSRTSDDVQNDFESWVADGKALNDVCYTLVRVLVEKASELVGKKNIKALIQSVRKFLGIVSSWSLFCWGFSCWSFFCRSWSFRRWLFRRRCWFFSCWRFFSWSWSRSLLLGRWRTSWRWLWRIRILVWLDEWNLSTVWWEVLLELEWRRFFWWGGNCWRSLCFTLSWRCWRCSFNSRRGNDGSNCFNDCRWRGLPWWRSVWLRSAVSPDWIDTVNEVNEGKVKIVSDFGEVLFGYY